MRAVPGIVVAVQRTAATAGWRRSDARGARYCAERILVCRRSPKSSSIVESVTRRACHTLPLPLLQSPSEELGTRPRNSKESVQRGIAATLAPLAGWCFLRLAPYSTLAQPVPPIPFRHIFTQDTQSTKEPPHNLALAKRYSFFSISTALSSNKACQDGARIQSQSSCAAPALASCWAVGA